MRFSLPSRLIGTVTAATLALTALGTTPAFADDERAARAIAALLGIAVIGAILNEERDERSHRPQALPKKQRSQVQAQQHRHGANKHSHVVRQSQHNHRTKTQRPRVEAKPLPQRVNRKLLPQRCLRSFETRNGRARMFGRKCMERNYRHVDRLPQHCFQRIRTYDGNRAGFGVRCLRRAGYSLARQ